MKLLYWVTGLAGAGKTTIATAFAKRLREGGEPVAMLDGDSLRAALAQNYQHTPADRLTLAWTYARLAHLLHQQELTVICATISPFSEVRNWLRHSTSGYREIYVRASLDTLRCRDQKGLYSQAEQRTDTHLVGYDIPFNEPQAPHLIIDNEPSTDVRDHVAALLGLHSAPLREVALQ